MRYSAKLVVFLKNFQKYITLANKPFLELCFVDAWACEDVHSAS